MKFSIRDLLLVTLIVALAAGWWVAIAASERTVHRNLQSSAAHSFSTRPESLQAVTN